MPWNHFHIQKELERIVADHKTALFDPPALGAAVAPYLNALVDNGTIQEWRLKPTEIYFTTWKQLYPNPFKRLINWAIHHWIGPSNQPRWYHHVLPYRAEFSVVINWDGVYEVGPAPADFQKWRKEVEREAEIHYRAWINAPGEYYAVMIETRLAQWTRFQIIVTE